MILLCLWFLYCTLNASPNIILFGCPGAGKGTLAQTLVSRSGCIHIGSGNILREEIRQGSELGNVIKEIMSKDEIISDDIMIQMVKQRLISTLEQGKNFILEGFPYNLSQLQFLEDFLMLHNIKNVCFICVTVDPHAAVERILNRKTCGQCGATYNIKTNETKQDDQCDRCKGLLITRADDNEVCVSKRVQHYPSSIQPVLDFYKKQNQLIEIDGNQDIWKVYKDFEKILCDVQ